MKLVIVTCYKQPDYIRAQTLRSGVAQYKGIELITLKNRHLGLLRYPEVIVRLILIRIRDKPDVYFLTFRGYEILPIMAILTWPKVLIYDEFINPIEWLQEPREQLWPHLVPQSLLQWFYRLVLRRCKVILTDTDAHAKYSQKLTKVTPEKFAIVPVSTNEKMFKPAKIPANRPKRKDFKVFYYGNMLPLHGLEYVLKAAIELQTLPIEFLIVGGDTKSLQSIESAQAKGANIVYMPWVPFKNLPILIKKSDLCLGGPLGGTEQAQRVITGKTYQFLASAAPTVIGIGKATGLFNDKENCLLVTQKDSKSLSQAIRWAYKNTDRLSSIGQKGRLVYEANYSQKIVAQKLKIILDSLT